MTDQPDPLKIAGITALFACGHDGPSATAAPPVRAYAKAFASAVAGLCAATPALGRDGKALAQALFPLASNGLIPGGQSNPAATAYLFEQNRTLTGRPSPRGRRAMARAAGVAIHAIAAGKKDVIKLDDDGYVSVFESDPDERPTTWDALRGVVVNLDDLHTGERRKAWVSAAEIGARKAKSKGGAWGTDAIGMACTKAVSILIDRGAIPQASLLPSILGPARYASAIDVATLPHPAPAELPPPSAPAALAAPAEDEPAPPAEPEPDAPAEDVAEQAAPVALPPDLYFDLAADAECGRDYAYEAITRAVDSLTAAGRPADEAALRAPPVWARLVQRAAQIARDAADAGG